jgi:hypothetical protein
VGESNLLFVVGLRSARDETKFTSVSHVSTADFP